MVIKTLIRGFLVQLLETCRHHFHENKSVFFMNTRDISDGASPRDFFKDYTDEHLLSLFTHGYSLGCKLNGLIPTMPPEEMQRNWTGMIGEDTMREALHFYQIVTEMMAKYSTGIKENTIVLDFGTGWGRIIRFFLRDVRHENLYGLDCYPEAIEMAKAHNRWCAFEVNDPLPPSSFEANQFNLVYLFSVFSHLSEEAHLKWSEEFHRILQPGGLLIATTRPRSFIEEVAQLRENKDIPIHLRGSAASFENTETALKQYDQGLFVHSATGGGGPLATSFYGESCIPLKYVKNVWCKWFELEEYRDADTKCNQNVICCSNK